MIQHSNLYISISSCSYHSSAAKTALLLDNTQLGHSQVQVSSAASIDELAKSGSGADHGARDEHDISQEDKPRSRIVAEYLAHGYTISDTAIQRAIALDNKHGVSTRFTNALLQFDSKYKASDKAKGIDASYGITEKANAGWQGLTSYFEKALGTPTGQKLATFYTQSDKQVRDIHAEARRLADLKSGKASQGPAEHEGGSKNEQSKQTEQAEQAEFKGEKSATGPAAEVAASSGVAPLGEKSV